MAGVIQAESGGGGLFGKLLSIGATLASGGALGAGMVGAAPWLSAAGTLFGGNGGNVQQQQQQTGQAPQPTQPAPQDSFSDAWMKATYPEYAQGALHNPWRRR